MFTVIFVKSTSEFWMVVLVYHSFHKNMKHHFFQTSS